jgi:hypothetical protein
MQDLSQQTDRKFIETYTVSDWQVQTDTGWQDIEQTHRTVKYTVWELLLSNGMRLRCADTHIVFNVENEQVYVKDLSPGDQIQTASGLAAVLSVNATTEAEHMYDLGVNSADHRYYTGGILSHNSTTAAGYLLWHAMFVPDSTILIAAHKYLGAQEIMQRIRYAYENTPDFIRAGVTSYNKGSIEFENSSRIVAQTTTETTGRGMSITCLSTQNTQVTVREKLNGEVTSVTIRKLADLIGHKTETACSQFEVLTTAGFKEFSGITLSEKDTYRLQLESRFVECTPDHSFFSGSRWAWVQFQEIHLGELIQTHNGFEKCISKEHVGVQEVGDLVNVANVHSFIANGINAHNCLYLDEFAFVRPNIAREFWVSISPTLSTGGKALITSTPSSDEDQFATIWKQANKCVDEYGNPTQVGINGFKAFQSHWWEHPDRDETWKQAEMGRIGEERFRREHLCEFLTAEETLISSMKLSALHGRQPAFYQGQVRWYKEPELNRVYLVALDPSLGTGGDHAAIQVFESPSMIQVAEWQHNRTPIQKQIGVLREITRYLADIVGTENVYYSVENNSLGEAALVCIAEIGEENIAGIFLSEPVQAGSNRRYRRGFTTTNKSKLAACSKLKGLVETDRMVINSINLVSELKTFVSSGAGFAAKSGETDDLVLALLLIVRMIQVVKQYHVDLDQQVTDRDQEMLEPLPFISVFR